MPVVDLRAERNTLYTAGRILIVDDQTEMVDSLKRTLRAAGYTRVEGTSDSRLVLSLYDRFQPDLLLLDLHMPHIDGFRVLAEFNARLPEVYFPVLILTGDSSSESKQSALSLGAKDFLNVPFDPIELQLRVKNLLETRFLHLRLRNQNESLEELVAQRTAELREANSEMIARLAAAAEYHDDETGQHALRVGRLAQRIALQLGLPPEEAARIGQAAPLHDVGKLGIRDQILCKPGQLTADEYTAMKRHTFIGALILGGSRSSLLQLAETIALHHHERWDGGGYMGLSGTEIPLAARIVAVADAFDVMTHSRRYCAAQPIEVACADVERQSGKQFDPEVVAAFARIEVTRLEVEHPGARRAPGTGEARAEKSPG